MYEVVLGVDRNESRARAQARTVADLPDADESVHATLVHVFTENPRGASVHQVTSVRRAREVLEDAGVEVTLAESSGDPARELLDVAEERDADLVCLAGRKRSPTQKALLGSVTQDVVLDTDRPILVCAETDEGRD